MAVSHKEVIASLPPEERALIKALVQEMIEEEKTLRDLRTAQQLTQRRVAKLLGVQQDSVSRMERRTDMLLSTMSNYVEAMGGKLRLIAEFPNHQPYTVKLSDLSEVGTDPKRRKPAPKGKAREKKVAPNRKPVTQKTQRANAA